MNEKDNNTSKLNNKRLRITFSIVVLLSISFAASFLITDYLTNPNKKRVEVNEEDKNVLNQNGVYLSDDTNIILKESENNIIKKKLEDIKSEFGLIGETTKEKLKLALKDKGYLLSNEKDDELTFEKDSTKTVETNKFFLGELDGNIVIYKSNDNGKLEKVEVDLKQFRRLKKVSELKDEEQKLIKTNYYKYNSLDEAIEILSGYDS